MTDILFPTIPQADKDGNTKASDIAAYQKNMQDVISRLNTVSATSLSALSTSLASATSQIAQMANKIGAPDYDNKVSKSWDVVYQAETNGWISVTAEDVCMGYAFIYIGNTNNPTMLLEEFGNDINSNYKRYSFFVAIPKGYYYKVWTWSLDYPNHVYWVPEK